jgi:hypothetical protein
MAAMVVRVMAWLSRGFGFRFLVRLLSLAGAEVKCGLTGTAVPAQGKDA